ncbi:hypothetical protein QQP08_021883 [Theobroma cacao]|nr:hypothetical protein QQP08_021883 [Theobroma cacao]
MVKVSVVSEHKLGIEKSEKQIEEPTINTPLSDTQKVKIEGLKLNDLKAKNNLFQEVDQSILEMILSKDISKQIWDSMKKKISKINKDEKVAVSSISFKV